MKTMLQFIGGVRQSLRVIIFLISRTLKFILHNIEFAIKNVSCPPLTSF